MLNVLKDEDWLVFHWSADNLIQWRLKSALGRTLYVEYVVGSGEYWLVHRTRFDEPKKVGGPYDTLEAAKVVYLMLHETYPSTPMF